MYVKQNLVDDCVCKILSRYPERQLSFPHTVACHVCQEAPWLIQGPPDKCSMKSNLMKQRRTPIKYSSPSPLADTGDSIADVGDPYMYRRPSGPQGNPLADTEGHLPDTRGSIAGTGEPDLNTFRRLHPGRTSRHPHWKQSRESRLSQCH